MGQCRCFFPYELDSISFQTICILSMIKTSADLEMTNKSKCESDHCKQFRMFELWAWICLNSRSAMTQAANQTLAPAEWSKKQKGKHNEADAVLMPSLVQPVKQSFILSLVLCLCQEAAMGQYPVSSLHHWLLLPQRSDERHYKIQQCSLYTLVVLVNITFWKNKLFSLVTCCNDLLTSTNKQTQ